MKTWLLVDSHYLCHRAFHSMGNLTFGDYRTGTIFGFLKTMIELDDLFQPLRHVYCFDAGKNKRKEIYQKYKEGRAARRKAMTGEQREAYQGLQKQIRKLQYSILQRLGYRNVLYEIGYEADDIIASVCQNKPTDVEIIMVGADHDLYQLLGKDVMMYDLKRKRMMTAESFKEEFGIEPTQWADVKAIAGCTSDDVHGVKGVGEKSAIKFLTGSLSGTRFDSIANNSAIWKRNLKLVELPFVGTPTYEIRRDRTSKDRWETVCSKYGLKSLLGRIK